MVKHVFLDLDDTLLDFRRAEASALSRSLRAFGMEPKQAVLERYHELNRQQWELLERGEITRDQLLVRRFDLLFAELGVTCSSREFCAVYERRLSEGYFFLPGAEALLETLHGTYDLYLATNGASLVQRGRLKGTGIGRYFKDIFISEEMPADKPSLAYFQACFARIPDFDPAAAVMVGDSLTSDIRGGLRAGIRTCWFNPHGVPRREDLAPDVEFGDLSELPGLLASM